VQAKIKDVGVNMNKEEHVKETQSLTAELRMIADTLTSRYCRGVIREAAQRLEETEKIAEFYRKQAEKHQKM
jgi:hypothetical protein